MAARACALGMDGMVLLTTTDPVVRLVMSAVVEKAEVFGRELDEARATLIANAVGRLFNG